MVFASVPEAAVNLNSQTVAGEGNIDRTAFVILEGVKFNPKAPAAAMESTSYRDFGLCISRTICFHG